MYVILGVKEEKHKKNSLPEPGLCTFRLQLLVLLQRLLSSLLAEGYGKIEASPWFSWLN